MTESLFWLDEEELFNLVSAATNPFGLSSLSVDNPNALWTFIQAGSCSIPVSEFEAGR